MLSIVYNSIPLDLPFIVERMSAAHLIFDATRHWHKHAHELVSTMTFPCTNIRGWNICLIWQSVWIDRICSAWYPDVCYIIFGHLLHMRSGRTGNLFSLSLGSLWWLQIFGYVLACRPYSFVCTVHHLIMPQNACQIYFVEGVSKIKHILSVIPHTICGAVCFQLPISLVMIEIIEYIYFVLSSSSNRKYEL